MSTFDMLVVIVIMLALKSFYDQTRMWTMEDRVKKLEESGHHVDRFGRSVTFGDYTISDREDA